MRIWAMTPGLSFSWAAAGVLKQRANNRKGRKTFKDFMV